MKDSLCVGKVVEIIGNRVNVLMNDNTNMFTYYIRGKKYQGVTINSYVGIVRGPLILVARVEKEFLQDKFQSGTSNTFDNQIGYSINRFERTVIVNVIGVFRNNKFTSGLFAYPLLYNDVILLSEDQIEQVVSNSTKCEDSSFKIGTTLVEGIDYNLNWNKIFNSHIGIFGNTGSGKSNTLNKLYTKLLNNNEINTNNSNFLILDFNGEYTGNQIVEGSNKVVYSLNTRSNAGDKIPMSPIEFFDSDILSLLFSATTMTQKPFINNIINYYYKANSYTISDENITKYVCEGFRNVFEANNNKEALEQLKLIYNKIGLDNTEINELWGNMSWHSQQKTYYYNTLYVNDSNSNIIIDQKVHTLKELLYSKNFSLNDFEKFEILMHLQMIFGLRYNHFQFDHINPLLQRVSSRGRIFEKVIKIENSSTNDTSKLKVISLRECNQDVKKIIPLLVSIKAYNKHKTEFKIDNPKTFHLIIDEAHNILSESSKRESSEWKDYRLDVFEEIVKEGRKYGFYLTISSQRPADISSTIVSQLHNLFIHRLVNDNDLYLLDKSISTLGKAEKDAIPNLTAGSCVVTGTGFDIPLTIQVDYIEDKKQRPDSDDIDLVKLWKK